MLRSCVLVWAVLVSAWMVHGTTEAAKYMAVRIYEADDSCATNARVLAYAPTDDCEETTCEPVVSSFFKASSCVPDYKADIATCMKGSPYVITEVFNPGCIGGATLVSAIVADGRCYPASTTSSYKATLGPDLSVTYYEYDGDGTCSTTAKPDPYTSEQAKGRECVNGKIIVTAVRGVGPLAPISGGKPVGNSTGGTGATDAAHTVGPGLQKPSSSTSPRPVRVGRRVLALVLALGVGCVLS